MPNILKIISVFLVFIFYGSSCFQLNNNRFPKTENVIILVQDGARYTETWGDETHENIPYFNKFIANEGIINVNFRNIGDTYTLPGHTAICTGVYRQINNSGLELPKDPSIFQYYLKNYSLDSTKAAIITSKDKLEVLSDCTDPQWNTKYRPMTNCGINGLGSGYRHDTITCRKALNIMDEFHPNLVLINFREPDYSGHKGNWEDYIIGIKLVDSLTYEIWNFINNNENYKNKTAFFLTNDHGRHSNGVANGFISHGDNCEGCRHIFFYAYGPDFKNHDIVFRDRNLSDISKTAADMLGFEMPTSNGEVMDELFK